MKVTKVLITLCFTSLILSPAFSQEENLPAAAKIETMTVYGTSTSVEVFDYPGSVDVISREEIDFLSPSAISDIFINIPGLEFSNGPRRTGEVPSIR